MQVEVIEATWLQAMEKFFSAIPAQTKATIDEKDWIVFTFESKESNGP